MNHVLGDHRVQGSYLIRYRQHSVEPCKQHCLLVNQSVAERSHILRQTAGKHDQLQVALLYQQIHNRRSNAYLGNLQHTCLLAENPELPSRAGWCSFQKRLTRCVLPDELSLLESPQIVPHHNQQYSYRALACVSPDSANLNTILSKN